MDSAGSVPNSEITGSIKTTDHLPLLISNYSVHASNCPVATSIAFIPDGLSLSVTYPCLMTAAVSNDDVVEQIQNGLYVVTVCMRRRNPPMLNNCFEKGEVFLYG